MARIIKGYWDCKFCGRTGIDGLVDICESCGKQKSEDVKYYMKKEKIEVTDEELAKAGIRREECDGDHKDWVCNYCNQLNNWSDFYCKACNSSKEEATHEYGLQEIDDSNSPQGEVQEIFAESEPVSNKMEENTTPVDEEAEEPTILEQIIHAILSVIFMPIFFVITNPSVLVFLLTLIIPLYVFWPITKETNVTGFTWERVVTIEEEQTVKESDWDVPPGGRVYDEQWEFKEYESVFDHYETITETKSRQVIDYYETNTYYTDNGNGTFTEHTSQTPVYTTEYYTETHQEPVYRQEAVYDTKYYYEIERWIAVNSYLSNGNDQTPYWNEEYVLKDNQRDTLRHELYTVIYDDNTTANVPFDEWMTISAGDGYEIKTCRLGIVYEKEEIEK